MHDNIIIAIDTPSLSEAIRRIDMMDPFTDTFKLGHIIYSSEYFWSIVKYLRDRNKSIFLDLKLWDIPVTVESTIDNLISRNDENFKYITIHNQCLPKETVLRISQKITPVAVGHLSSNNFILNKAEWQYMGIKEQGYSHAICPPSCIQPIQGLAQFVPGIRLKTQDKDNHTSTITPWDALKSGADKVILGSAIFKEKDPLKTASMIWQECNNYT